MIRELVRVVGQSLAYSLHLRSASLAILLVVGAVVAALGLLVLTTTPVFLYPLL